METQNVGNWLALTKHFWTAVSRGDSLPNRPLDIIDIGCHTGGLLALFLRDQQRMSDRVRSLGGVEPLEGPRQIAQARLPEAKFYEDIEEVPDQSVDVVLGHEFLYLIFGLDRWMLELKRILRPEGGAFISLGSHGENTAWNRWRPRLEQLYGHLGWPHQPTMILQLGAEAGFKMEIHRLHPKPRTVLRYSPPEDGWGKFESAEEMFKFYNKWKYVFVFYPKQ